MCMLLLPSISYICRANLRQIESLHRETETVFIALRRQPRFEHQREEPLEKNVVLYSDRQTQN